MREEHRRGDARRDVWADLVFEPDGVTQQLAELAQQLQAEALEARRRQLAAFYGGLQLLPEVRQLMTPAARWRSGGGR